jgi:putative transposase
MPFPVEAIQVDGSSEFKAEFEQACQARGSAFTNCRPTGRRSRRPRALLWIMRYEFYACYELPRSVEALFQYSKSLQQLYNQCRPHGALAGQTTASYLKER